MPSLISSRHKAGQLIIAANPSCGQPVHQLGSRAAVLRRNEPTRFSSASDDEVGGYKARSARSERKRAEQSNVVLPEPAGPLTITKVGSDMLRNYPRVNPRGSLRMTTALVRRCASSSLLRNDPLAVFSAADTV
jgi:hypothetical protein